MPRLPLLRSALLAASCLAAAGGAAAASPSPGAGSAPAPSPAPAAPSALPIDLGGGSIQLQLELPDGDGGFTPRNEEENRRHFNRAHCLCPEVEFGVEFRLENAPASLESEPVEVWLGTQCDSDEVTIRDANCELAHTFPDVGDLRTPQTVGFSVAELALSCEPAQRERRVFALIDENDDGINTEDGDYVGETLAILVDTQPPPEPTDLEAAGGEGAVEISWTLPSSRTDDIEYFQALCARADGSTSEDDALPRDLTTRYITAEMACGVEDPTICPQTIAVEHVRPGGGDGGPIGADAGVEPDGGPGPDGGGAVMCAADLPGGLATLDDAHLCGEATGTQSSIRIEGLENGVAYRIVLVAVDPSRNPTALDLGEHTPSPVQDFWEEYRDSGGRARGGCSAADGRGGLLVLMVLAMAVTGARALRRRRRRGGGRLLLGGLLLVAAGSGAASAQPWWEDVNEPVQDEVGAAPVHWNLEIKFGPYVPDVDSEFDLGADEAGPFERMFGDGPFLMSGVTLDRYFLHPGGQLGVTGSIGYFSRSAGAFQVDEEGNVVTDEDGMPVRSGGDQTRFRMIPMSLGVVYRFTQLDDRLRVPVIPYARAGLSYYYWWITAPSGDVAEVPTMDCPDLGEDCDGDKARGGSLGWQATAGLAFRLERLDPDAEVALRTELGIEHAGLFVEGTVARVDGFGSEEKLSVGDVTWFGGINFEF